MSNPFVQLDAVPLDIDPALGRVLRQWHAQFMQLRGVNPAGTDQVAVQRANGLYVAPSEISASLELGSAALLADPITIAHGGTGQITKAAAFDALSPVTARGDLIVRDASTNTRKAIGSAGTFLKSDGTDPSWADIPIYETAEFYATNATARGASLRGAVNTTDNNLAFQVPSGKTMKAVAARGRFRTGANVGTYTVNVIIYNATDAAVVKIATATGTAGTDIYATAFGTPASPLGTLAAGKLYLIGWFNDGASPGGLDGVEKHHVSVTFVME